MVYSYYRPAQLFSTKREDSFTHAESPTSEGNTQACSLGVNTLNGIFVLLFIIIYNSILW